MKTTLRIFPFALIALTTLATAAHAEDARILVDAEKAAIPFVPFTIADVINPETHQPYSPSDILRIEAEGRVTFNGTAEELLAEMNKAEKHYAEIGTSLRTIGDQTPMEFIANTKQIGQKVQGLRLAGTIVRDKVRDALTRCDLVTISDLGVKAETRVPFLKDDVVQLEKGMNLTAQQLVDNLNRQQKALCDVGYDLFEGVSRGANDALSRILARRTSLLSELGISSMHPIFDFSALGNVPTMQDVEKAMAAAKAAAEKPSIATISALVEQSGAQLPAEWKVPDLPNIPFKEMPKRRDLALLKHKTWGGFDIGDHAIAAIYSNAGYEVRAAEKPHRVLDARGQGVAGVYVLGGDHKLAVADAVFTAETGAGIQAHVKFAVVGNHVFEPVNESVPDRWSKADPAAFKMDLPIPPWQTQFAVGPVPCTAKAQVTGSAYVGYEIGLDLEGLHAKAVPGARADLHIEGGVGTNGLSAGASGDILIFDASVPIYGEALLRGLDDEPFLSLSIYGDLDYRYLDGQVSAYAEYPWFRCKSLTKCGFTTKRAERKLFDWTGGGGQHRFFDWGMDIRPFGAKMRGDLIDQADRDELLEVERAATLDQKKLEVAKAELAVQTKERQTMVDLMADLGGTAAKGVATSSVSYNDAHAALIARTEEVVRLAAQTGAR